ncbi:MULTISPECIES: hypothetical protein [unclassified Thioalkalivibrio]|uniref:hypothetical protein n=1 Tax=unclassified Thioalkalivibrio TaxID=2621013 RepID=UPI001E583EA0|nr:MULTISPECIES: hypothetical protein [unclassified Thioalkalivibrio]
MSSEKEDTHDFLTEGVDAVVIGYGSGGFGFLVLAVVLGCPALFFLGYVELAFFSLGVGMFLMLSLVAAVVVLINNREQDREDRELKDRSD